ncbi:MAG: hypothetical protein ACREBR_01425, partial [bacterium]
LDEARVQSELTGAQDKFKAQHASERSLLYASCEELLGIDNSLNLVGTQARKESGLRDGVSYAKSLTGGCTHYFASSIILKSTTVRMLLGGAYYASRVDGVNGLNSGTLNILNCNESDSCHRKEMIRMLHLEQNAIKWYGVLVCKAYFALEVVPRIKGVATCPQDSNKRLKTSNCGDRTTLTEIIQDEAKRLELSLYSLSEQSGGVPRIFIRATEAARKNGTLNKNCWYDDNGDNHQDDDDEEVIEVFAEDIAVSLNGEKESNSCSTAKKKSGTKEKEVAALPDIIEIL